MDRQVYAVTFACARNVNGLIIIKQNFLASRSGNIYILVIPGREIKESEDTVLI